MLSTSAFTGSTTLPVSRNSSTSMMTAISPSTSGSREVIACTLSRLVWAGPVNSTVRPPGVGNRVQPGQLVLGARRRTAAATLPTVSRVLPDASPVAASGGPTSWPSTKVPEGADTESTSGTRDRSAA